MLIHIHKGDRCPDAEFRVLVPNLFKEDSMNEDQEKKKSTALKNKKILSFDRPRGTKKPYEAPTLKKLGDVATLTNVSVIV